MKDRSVLIVLLLVQLIVCFSVVTLFPISMDEPFSIFYSQQSIDELLNVFTDSNNPPLHFFVLHFWIKLFGISPFAVRSLSILISLISVAVLYKLGRKFWRKEYAVLLVGLFIFSRLNHFTAMEARMYGLFTLFFVLIMKDLHALIVDNKKVFLQLGVWNALLFYSHYLAGTVMLMEVIVLLCFYKRWTINKWLQGVGVLLITGLLLFPILRLFFTRVGDFSENGTWVADATPFDLWANLVKLLNNEFAVFLSVGLIITVVYLYKRFSVAKEEGKGVVIRYFGLWFLGTYFLFYLISVFVQPIFIAKYLQFLTIPLFFVIVSVLAKFKPEGKLKYAHLIVLVPFMLSFKPIPDINRETDKLVEYLKIERTENTIIYYCPPHYDLTLAYHYNIDWFKAYKTVENNMLNGGFYPVYNSGDIKGLESVDKIIYVDFNSTFLYSDNDMLDYLNTNHSFVSSKTFKGDFNVYNYAF